ncbi:MAG: anthranilate synthase component II [Bacteroidota bacterium]
MKRILVIDNYDSFTYNLVHAVQKITGRKTDVYRNDMIPLEEVKKYDKIILSPGPGIPNEAGNLKAIIKEYAPGKSIFGVCLGLQAIGEVFGGKLLNLNKVYHGVASQISVLVNDEPLFRGIPDKFDAGRYHSWIVKQEELPAELEITAKDPENEIMALRHVKYDVRGVQFHPESVLTPHGEQMIKNWLNS